MTLHRRSILQLAALAPAAPFRAWAADAPVPADAPAQAAPTFWIGTGLVQLAPDHVVSTTLYNDQFPGPLLRFTEGKRVVVDIFNDTDTPELVHWHGQTNPRDGGCQEPGLAARLRGRLRPVQHQRENARSG